MKRELRLLLVEDVALDAELIEHELHRAGLRFRAKRVESREEFLHELEQHPPDLILSDHGIPAFDGFSALATARQRCPAVPFIFVTGAHGDEVAVETLKRGADDYVLKSRLHRLVPSVEQALARASDRARHRQTELALRQAREQLRWLAEAAHGYGLLGLNQRDCVTEWSPGAERITGFAAGEAQGRAFASLFSPAEHDKVSRALHQARQQQRHAESGWRVARKDQSEVAAAVLLGAAAEPTESNVELWCVLCDLTPERQAAEQAQRQAETKARHYAAQFRADYRELQELACQLGLAMRPPLRQIDSFVERLHKSADERLDVKERKCLTTISESAGQMSHLLDELLNFARVGQVERFRLQFSLADLVQEIIQELSRETEGRRVEWEVGPLPEVSGDPTLLSQALSRLLSNALKFTAPRPVARIQLSSRCTEQEIIISITDNGVGFDPRRSERLFGIFQRLHPGEQFPGLGLGLAQVRRIIQSHGGRTWAEGTPERGATFSFSLPRCEAAPREEATES